MMYVEEVVGRFQEPTQYVTLRKLSSVCNIPDTHINSQRPLQQTKFVPVQAKRTPVLRLGSEHVFLPLNKTLSIAIDTYWKRKNYFDPMESCWVY